MAGHSKFKNIMHRKGAQDKKRAGLFAKLSKEITVAAKMGGEDPDSNARLRMSIVTARSNSMPKDNIERAIKKGIGGGDDANYDEIRYEGYGPGGIAVLVDVLTDNRNRAASEIRSTFSKNGGNMGEQGSVAFMFDRVGEIEYAADACDADAMFEVALEAGAENVESSEDGHEITTAAEDLHAVTSALEAKFGEPKGAKLTWKPKTLTSIGEDKALQVMKFMDAMDDNDDVQNVSANFDIADDIMEKLVEQG